MSWRLAVHLFADEPSTPVNDASVLWTSPRIDIGELTIDGPPSPQDEEAIDRLAFNPANGFDALGITHARQEVYGASARNRGNVTPAAEARRWLLVHP